MVPLAALVAAVAALALAAPASASHSEVTFFDASNQLSGLYGTASRTRALDEMAALGVDVVRYEVYWRQIAPGADQTAPPAGFNARDPLSYGANGANWDSVDTVVKGAEARGMKVSLVLTGAPPSGQVPRWASRDPNGTESDPSPEAFSDFAYAVAKRYGGGTGSIGNAAYISIWNEPNSPTFLRAKAGQGAAQVVSLYRELIVAGRQGLTAAGYTGTIIAGELGPVALDKLRDPLNFARAVLCISRSGKRVGSCPNLGVSGWSHHPYLFSRAPFLKPFGGRQVSFGNLRTMQKVVKQARRAGVLAKSSRFYVTEFGFPSRPDSPIGVPRREQAEFISIAEYLAYNNPGLASYAQYLLRDDPRGSKAYGFASGLCPASAPDSGPLGAGQGCKPAYGAFRTPLVVRARSAKRVTIWGRVRPATGPVTVRIRFRDGRGAVKPLRSVTTNGAGYFQFNAPSKPRRAWGVAWGKLKGPLVRAYRF